MIRWSLVASLALIGLGQIQDAAAFPNRPIKLIIPFAAGGTAEPLARLLADVIQKKTGTGLIIESRPGAGGNVGAAEVAKSDKDGYTLLLGANNNFVVNQFLFANATIDPERDFELISILADQFQVMYVNAEFVPKTVGELIAYIKQRPGQINFASPGVGTAPHLSGELVSDLNDLKMVHVPYKGGGPAITGLLFGEVQLYLASLSVGKGQIDAGKLRALAVTSPTRMKSLPDVPTTREAGIPDYTVSNWWGLAAPKGTPATALEWIGREFTQAMQDPNARTRLEELGFLINAGSSAEFRDRLGKEAALYRGLIERRQLAIKP